VNATITRDIGEQLVFASLVLGAVLYLVHKVRIGIVWFVSLLRRLDRAVEAVETQLYPNGGATLRDAVDRIQERLGIENVAPDAEHHD